MLLMITEEGSAIAKRRIKWNDCYDGRSLNGARGVHNVGRVKIEVAEDKSEHLYVSFAIDPVESWSEESQEGVVSILGKQG